MNIQVMFEVCVWNDCIEYLYTLGLSYFTRMGLCIRCSPYRDDELWIDTYTGLEWNRIK
jgi:hypothetical protein